MPEAAAAYPLLRQARQRRRSARPDLRRWARPIAMLVLAAMLVAGVVIARRPAAPDAQQLLADTLATLKAGNYSAARRNGEHAVAADPASARAHLALAEAYRRLGDGVALEAEAARAEAAGAPAATLRPLRTEAALLQGDAAGALAMPGATDVVRTRALAALGRTGEAQAALIARVSGRSDDADAWTALGRLRLGLGEMGGAAQAAERAVRLTPREPGALTLQGEVVRERYGPAAALPWFAAALKSDAFFHPALIEQAATLGEVGRNADALAATRRALLARPGSPAALFLQAVIAARGGRSELAQRLLSAAGGEVADRPGALLLQGVLDARAGRTEQAVAGWRRLVEAQPMNVVARRLLAGTLLSSGDARGALDVLRPIALRPDADAYSLRLAARAWEVTGDRGAAAALLDRAMRAGAVGGVFATDESAGALAAEAAQAPGDPTYVVGVIRALAMNDRAAALAKARLLAAAAPGAPDAVLALGDMQAASGDSRGAASSYARAANLRFDAPTAWRLIDALGRAGRNREAATALALFVRQNPESLTAQRLRGHLLVASGEWDAAIETLEGVRRGTGGREAAVLVDLALAYAGAGQGDVARRYGAAAYRLQPMSAAVCDAYGAALAADGELDGARQLFDKALSLAPGDATILEHGRRVG